MNLYIKEKRSGMCLIRLERMNSYAIVILPKMISISPKNIFLVLSLTHHNFLKKEIKTIRDLIGM